MPKLFLSHRLDILVQHLAAELAQDDRDFFTQRMIVVPNVSLKQWVLLQLTLWSKEQAVANCKILTLQEAIKIWFPISGFTEIFCSLFLALSESQHEELRNYLQGSCTRTVELSNQLADLWIRYSYFCPSLFAYRAQEGLSCYDRARQNTIDSNEKRHSQLGKGDEENRLGKVAAGQNMSNLTERAIASQTCEGWQKQLIQSLFASGKLRTFLQFSPLSPSSNIHCFGFDFLPQTLWDLFRFSFVYLFSPCSQFWEDLCSDQERRKIGRFWKRKGVEDDKLKELNDYLKDAPPLLANWGKAGRETLKILDRFEPEIIEDYQFCEETPRSSLKRLQKKLLDFKKDEKIAYLSDPSIQISKTGSSLLREVEHLRVSILKLVTEEQLLFSDIAVLAPDIQLYEPLIQFVFTDLPFKMSGLDTGLKSAFYQGMHRLFELQQDCGEPLPKERRSSTPDRGCAELPAHELRPLFENPSFYRMRNWNADCLDMLLELLPKTVSNDFETRILDRFIYLHPEEKSPILSSSGDVLEECISVLLSLREDLAKLQEARSLSDWSIFLTDLMQKYFWIDLADETDAAAWNFFKRTMTELSKIEMGNRLFPFLPIKALLKRSMPTSQLNPSYLHAIRFATIEDGSMIPVRALFLLGMNEENFPRRSSSFSLDLLQNQKVYTFDPIDQDRYLLLQAIFCAQDFLHISYSHQSCDGNVINPSPLIEELQRSLDAPMKENKAPLLASNPSKKAFFDWPLKPSLSLPDNNVVISLSDLVSLSRHPWEFYLRKKFGIRLKEAEQEASFSLQKMTILRSSLQQPLDFLFKELPPGICGEALKGELCDQTKKWKDRIETWDLCIEPASLKLSCKATKKTDCGWEFPPLELNLTNELRVKIVGDIKNYSPKGFVHTGKESIDGLLRAWPECLAAAIVTNRSEIYVLRRGEVKLLDNPCTALKSFILYYFLALSAPSPLLVDWADPILRKGLAEWEKKMENTISGKGRRFEDPVFNWVFERIAWPLPKVWFEHWEHLLKEHFSQLATLYRGNNALV